MTGILFADDVPMDFMLTDDMLTKYADMPTSLEGVGHAPTPMLEEGVYPEHLCMLSVVLLKPVCFCLFLQTPKCLEYHPCNNNNNKNPVVGALSFTRLQLSGTSSPFLSAILPVDSFKSSLKTFPFSKIFSPVSLP